MSIGPGSSLTTPSRSIKIASHCVVWAIGWEPSGKEWIDSLELFSIQFRMETNNEFVLHAKRRSPQVAARPHHLLQDGVFIIDSRIKRQDFFSLCNRDLVCSIKEFPGVYFVKAFFPGIRDCFDLNLSGIKNLLRSFYKRVNFYEDRPNLFSFFVLRKKSKDR